MLFLAKERSHFSYFFQVFQITQEAEVFFSNIQDEKPVFQTTGHYSTLWLLPRVKARLLVVSKFSPTKQRMDR